MADNKKLTKSDLTEALKGIEKRIGGVETRLWSLENTVGEMDTKVINVEKNMVTQTEFGKRADGIEKRLGRLNEV